MIDIVNHVYPMSGKQHGYI